MHSASLETGREHLSGNAIQHHHYLRILGCFKFARVWSMAYDYQHVAVPSLVTILREPLEHVCVLTKAAGRRFWLPLTFQLCIRQFGWRRWFISCGCRLLTLVSIDFVGNQTRWYHWDRPWRCHSRQPFSGRHSSIGRRKSDVRGLNRQLEDQEAGREEDNEESRGKGASGKGLLCQREDKRELRLALHVSDSRLMKSNTSFRYCLFGPWRT